MSGAATRLRSGVFHSGNTAWIMACNCTGSGVETHLITSWFAAPLLVQNGGGLFVEITDGVDPAYRRLAVL
jgi:hypothetical protein